MNRWTRKQWGEWLLCARQGSTSIITDEAPLTEHDPTTVRTPHTPVVVPPDAVCEPTVRQTYVANVGRAAPRPASRRERKQLPLKQRVAELEETLSLLGGAVLQMRSDLEQYLGKPVARDILPRG